MVDPYRDVLLRFLARDPVALRDAPNSLTPVVRRLVNRLAGDLIQAGLADEAISQTFMLLLSPTARQFDTVRGSSAQYLYGVVQHASAEVRVQHGAAGIAKNDRRRWLMRDQQDSEHIRCHRRGPRYEDVADAICLHVDMEQALKAAPLELRTAANLLGERESSMTEAATVVRLDRNTLRRRLRAWATAAGLSA